MNRSSGSTKRCIWRYRFQATVLEIWSLSSSLILDTKFSHGPSTSSSFGRVLLSVSSNTCPTLEERIRVWNCHATRGHWKQQSSHMQCMEFTIVHGVLSSVHVGMNFAAARKLVGFLRQAYVNFGVEISVITHFIHIASKLYKWALSRKGKSIGQKGDWWVMRMNHGSFIALEWRKSVPCPSPTQSMLLSFSRPGMMISSRHCGR